MEDFSLEPERVGFIDARAYDDAGESVLRVNGTFYRAYGLDVLIGLPGACQVLAYDPDGAGGGAPTVDAGPTLTASIGGANAAVARTTVGTSINYNMAAGASLAYVPGDTLSISIPGEAGGFPAANIKVRTAEPFVMDLLVAPPSGPTPTVVTWSPATVSGSLMTLSLRYSTVDAVLTPNAQIYCVFHDNGTFTLPDDIRTAWAASDPESRSQFAQRVRESTVVINRSTRVRLFSFYGFPTPTLGGI